LVTDQTLERFHDSLVLVIGLMGQRFGTPAGSFESGTQAEFEWAAAHKKKGHPEAKWFFKRIDKFIAPPYRRDIQNAMRQWMKVQQFRHDYEGLYKEFVDAADFSHLFREDLFRSFSSWIAKGRTIVVRGQRADASDVPEVPDFLDNRISRIIHIITALEEMRDSISRCDEPCLRICAVMSSLGIDMDKSRIRPGDEEYSLLLERERDLIEELSEKGISLRVLLTWNVSEVLGWQERTREEVHRRLSRRRSFCLKVLEDIDRSKRVQIVHLSVRERNLLIVGNRYLFEGRKLSTKAGFEATQFIADKKRVTQETEMFDILLRNPVVHALAACGADKPKDLDRPLLEVLVARISCDIAELEASYSRSKGAQV
jgi:hypothetical protein